MIRSVLALAFLLVAASVSAQPDLGETTFDNSGSEAAQEPFLRGLLLLHSFEYDDARAAFQEAREIDPDFAMAAWGEAMTHNHPVWQQQDREAALDALARLGDDWAEAGETAREDAYLATLAVLYGDGDKEDRDDTYAREVGRLAAAYPDDLDAQAFHALAILGTAHEGRDFATYMKAAAIAEDVFAENPRHPGAAHYLIHAYDDPIHAPLGLRPALVYDQIAPSASHALHMPSHIYLALGMWDRVAEMNERSFEAARAGTDARGEPLNGHGWHALWWWHYAETQRDDPEAAQDLLALAQDLADADSDNSTAQAHIVRIAAQHAVAYPGSDVWARLDFPDAANLNSRAIYDLASGWSALADNANTAARDAADALLAAVEATDDPSWAARSGAAVLDGLVRLGEGDTEAGIARLREAAAIENAAPLTFGPPSPVVPSNEALGIALLRIGQPAEAADAFRAALDRAPGRRQSVAGLAEAERLMAGR